MQQAAIPGYKLSRAKYSTRVLTTLGVLGLLFGLLSAVALTVTKTGLTPTSVALYYCGQEVEPGLDALMTVENTRRSFQELAEVTHLHLMGGSILLFLLCHLLSVCEVTERLRVTLYVAGFLSFLATFGLPWLIVYVSKRFAWGYAPAVLILLASLVILSCLPIREMWFKSERA